MLLVHDTCTISSAFGDSGGSGSGPHMLWPDRIKPSQGPFSALLPAFLDVAAVADGNDENQQHVVVDLVDD
jgi:hypothetical protein